MPGSTDYDEIESPNWDAWAQRRREEEMSRRSSLIRSRSPSRDTQVPNAPTGKPAIPDEGEPEKPVGEAKIDERRRKLQKVREQINDPNTRVVLDPREEPEAVGVKNKLILNKKGVRTSHSSHPNNPGITLQDDQNKVRTGNKTLDTTVDIDKDFKNDKSMNARMKYAPPNIVNYYPMVLTKAPGILGAGNRGVLRNVIQIYRQLEDRFNEARGTKGRDEDRYSYGADFKV